MIESNTKNAMKVAVCHSLHPKPIIYEFLPAELTQHLGLFWLARFCPSCPVTVLALKVARHSFVPKAMM